MVVYNRKQGGTAFSGSLSDMEGEGAQEDPGHTQEPESSREGGFESGGFELGGFEPAWSSHDGGGTWREAKAFRVLKGRTCWRAEDRAARSPPGRSHLQAP